MDRLRLVELNPADRRHNYYYLELDELSDGNSLAQQYIGLGPTCLCLIYRCAYYSSDSDRIREVNAD